MNIQKNNKGFTLIELLAVLVILTAIMGIAIPTISSSLERNKAKQDQVKIKILTNAAELYVSDYKNKIYDNLRTRDVNTCCIGIDTLKNENYVSSDAAIYSNGSPINGSITFNKSNVSYTYNNTACNTNACV